MNWLQYLLEANLYLCLLYAGYYLFLRKETYYAANRFYLLAMCLLAFLIPFLQVGYLLPIQEAATTVASFSYTGTAVQTIAPAPPVFTWEQGLLYIYLSGVAVSLILFGIKLYKLYRLISKHPKTLADGYQLVYINEENTAFSFFNYLFIGKNTGDVNTITRHELVHIEQKHSADILFTELVKIINWFNPLVYHLQHSLKALHEYIADAHTAASDEDKLTYSTFLLNNAYGLQGLPVSNSFFNYNLLKNRITMLNQQRSGSLAGLKYLLAVPLCAAMLCASTLSFSKDYGFVDLLPNKNTASLPQTPVVADTVPKSGIISVADIEVPPSKSAKKSLSTNKSSISSVTTVERKDVKSKLTKAEIEKMYKEEVVEIELLEPEQFSNLPAKPRRTFKSKAGIIISRDKSDTTKIITGQVINPYADLLRFISNNVRYPAKARDNKTVGTLAVTFTIDNTGTVGDKFKVAGNVGDGCNLEVMRIIKDFKDKNTKVFVKPGQYTLHVTFTIQGEKDNDITQGPPPEPVDPAKYAGEVKIVAFSAKK